MKQKVITFLIFGKHCSHIIYVCYDMICLLQYKECGKKLLLNLNQRVIGIYVKHMLRRFELKLST